MTTSTPKQLLHLVFGGELTSTDSIEFKDLSKLDMVGMYPNFAEARRAWAAKAQATRGQRPDALFRGPYPPADGAGRRQDQH